MVRMPTLERLRSEAFDLLEAETVMSAHPDYSLSAFAKTRFGVPRELICRKQGSLMCGEAAIAEGLSPMFLLSIALAVP